MNEKSKMMLNPDADHVRYVRKALKDNGGYCPCQVDKTPDTKCPCKDFREGRGCDCGLYVPKEPQEFDIIV